MINYFGKFPNKPIKPSFDLYIYIYWKGKMYTKTVQKYFMLK